MRKKLGVVYVKLSWNVAYEVRPAGNDFKLECAKNDFKLVWVKHDCFWTAAAVVGEK